MSRNDCRSLNTYARRTESTSTYGRATSLRRASSNISSGSSVPSMCRCNSAFGSAVTSSIGCKVTCATDVWGWSAVDVDQLIEHATAEAGTSDFGPETDAMMEALRVLVRSVNEDADLSPEGDAAFSGMVHSLLTRRLAIEDWYRRHPEIDDEEIESVLFGLGLPRTGSTALSYLLAQDPDVRCLRQWEASQPTPPPELATETTDPRYLAAQRMTEIRSSIPAELRSMLPSGPNGPAECLDLMSMTFRCQALDVVAKTPQYERWFLGCDFGPAYRYHRRVIKLLQWHRPPSRWRLKTPAHIFGIDALDAEY